MLGKPFSFSRELGRRQNSWLAADLMRLMKAGTLKSGFSNWLAAACLVISIALPCISMACGLDWSVPENHFNGVDEQGYVEYWEKVEDVDFGAGLELPLVIGFRSRGDNGSPSPCLGPGWIIPLLESTFVQTGENSFEMLQPNGLTNLFIRKDETELNGSDGWIAEIRGDVISAWASCGWAIQFKKGRIMSLTTPTSRKLDFIYAGGMVVAIQEKGSAKLSVERDDKGKVVALVYNGHRARIILDQKPRIENIGGQNLVAGLDQSLRTIELSGSSGFGSSFQFETNDKLQPTLKVLRKDGNDRLITWDPFSKTILSDNDWKYSVGFPEGKSSEAELTRVNSKGQKEYWFEDGPAGRETTVDAAGVKTVQTWFISGELAGKTRKIEQSVNNGPIRVIQADSYNEQGDLIRGISHVMGSAVEVTTESLSDKSVKEVTDFGNGVQRVSVYKDGQVQEDYKIINGKRIELGDGL
jgi:hypothetical protein